MQTRPSELASWLDAQDGYHASVLRLVEYRRELLERQTAAATAAAEAMQNRPDLARLEDDPSLLGYLIVVVNLDVGATWERCWESTFSASRNWASMLHRYNQSINQFWLGTGTPLEARWTGS